MSPYNSGGGPVSPGHYDLYNRAQAPTEGVEIVVVRRMVLWAG